MWWMIISVFCGLGIIYIALRRYIYKLLTKNTNASVILDTFQKEAEAIITEFNRITDRNVTIAEETALKLNKLIEQSRQYLARLSKKHAHEEVLSKNYSPQTVHERSAKHRTFPETQTATPAHTQIAQLLQQQLSSEEIAMRLGVSVSEVETVSVMLNS